MHVCISHCICVCACTLPKVKINSGSKCTCACMFISIYKHTMQYPQQKMNVGSLCACLFQCVCVVTVCSTDRIMQALAELKGRGLGVSLSLSLYIYEWEGQRSEGEWGRAGCLEGRGEGLGGMGREGCLVGRGRGHGGRGEGVWEGRSGKRRGAGSGGVKGENKTFHSQINNLARGLGTKKAAIFFKSLFIPPIDIHCMECFSHGPFLLSLIHSAFTENETFTLKQQ